MTKFSTAQIESYQTMEQAVRELWTNHIDEGFDPQAAAHAVSLLAVNMLMKFYETEHVIEMIKQQVHVIEAGMAKEDASNMH